MRIPHAYTDVAHRLRRLPGRLVCLVAHRRLWKVVRLETVRVGTIYRCRVCGRAWTSILPRWEN
jgi:hypothetical protein